MTPHDAAVLAFLGRSRRRLLPPLIRLTLGRPTEDDLELPPRGPDESMSAWLCRLVSLDAPRTAMGPSMSPASLDALAAHALRRAGELGLAALPLGTAGYPPGLAEIADPPPVLWSRGDPADLHRPGVAIVGSRAASSHGLAMARRLAGDLASSGLVIVSGLARGIDSAAHEAALVAGGRTVAVLGSGHDRLYPPEHAHLASRIEQSGAVISEFPPGTGARAHHFPMRNRIVSGLVPAVVVVEAPEKSGALITAGCALDQGRDVFVVPGPVLGDRNRGGHGLLRDGARLAESADDILRELGGVPNAAAALGCLGGVPNAAAALGCLGGVPNAATALGGAQQPSDPSIMPSAADPHPWLRQMTEGVDFSVDDVAAQTDLAPADVLAGLLELELAGRVHRVGGGRFVRSSGRVLT